MNELEQTNAIIGLSMRIEGWPSTLADLGYTLERLELKFKVSDPQRPGIGIDINPDLLFVADQHNYSLIIELKSGRFQGFKQLDRFMALKPIALIRGARIPFRASVDPRKHRFSVSQVVNENFLNEYLLEFQRVAHQACLVSIGSTAIQTHHGEFADSRADREFKKGISLVGCYPPTKLLPVLPSTGEVIKLINSVVGAVKYLWLNNERSLTPERVAMVVFKRFWNLFDRPAQDRYLTVAQDVLKDMMQTEFHEYLRIMPGPSSQWRLLKLPESVEQRQRSRALQIFHKLVQDYKWRRQNDQPYDRRHPAQMSLEDILEEMETSQQQDAAAPENE